MQCPCLHVAGVWPGGEIWCVGDRAHHTDLEAVPGYTSCPRPYGDGAHHVYLEAAPKYALLSQGGLLGQLYGGARVEEDEGEVVEAVLVHHPRRRQGVISWYY